ncbi:MULTISPECIES: 4'-phosphopantetheinyl transferase superfamily protein [unclassified Streptomyces]|uniref:4'-phosphopantetheinyl transferase family protein n=1 Tax=unclassified Streptomyces TaxID=2593676 RepID=UPI0007503B0E|nr:4'-phosphopantetheinyl transferase superfamily protein [Streptomyces sp. E5N298]
MSPLRGGPRPPLSPPSRVDGPGGPWARLLHDLDTSGVGLVYASLADWRPQLPPEEERRFLLGRDWARYSRLTGEQLRDRFLATRLLIRCTAAVALGTEAGSLELSYGLNGRVHLRGHDQIDVSLSHTGDLLLCGITSLGVIGVDAEPRERRLSGRDVETLMCTAPERLRLAATADEERNGVLLSLWTLKEAYSKALGQGLRFPFTEFGFRTEGERERGPAGDAGPPSAETILLERSDGTPVADDTWRFATFDLPSGHLAALALQDTRRSDQPDTRAGTALNRQILAAIGALDH